MGLFFSPFVCCRCAQSSGLGAEAQQKTPTSSLPVPVCPGISHSLPFSPPESLGQRMELLSFENGLFVSPRPVVSRFQACRVSLSVFVLWNVPPLPSGLLFLYVLSANLCRNVTKNHIIVQHSTGGRVVLFSTPRLRSQASCQQASSMEKERGLPRNMTETIKTIKILSGRWGIVITSE